MNFDVERIVAGKRAERERLKNLPIAEKLRMLDDLRERTLVIRAAGEANRKQTRKARSSNS